MNGQLQSGLVEFETYLCDVSHPVKNRRTNFLLRYAQDFELCQPMNVFDHRSYLEKSLIGAFRLKQQLADPSRLFRKEAVCSFHLFRNPESLIRVVIADEDCLGKAAPVRDFLRILLLAPSEGVVLVLTEI